MARSLQMKEYYRIIKQNSLYLGDQTHTILITNTDPEIMKPSFIISALFLAFAISGAQAQTKGFHAFLSQFPKATLPYTFNAEDLQGQLEKGIAPKTAALSWEFYDFLPELERSAQYSSMPVRPEPLASFETPQYYAVLYNVARGLTRGTRTYSISVFDKKGNYIGSHFVAGTTPSVLTVATINEDLTALVQEFKINWANDYRTAGLKNNKVTGLTLVDRITIELATEGNPDQIEWTNRIEAGQASNDLVKTK